MKDGSSTTVSASRKVNLGRLDPKFQFESVDVFVSITVTPEMTTEDMQRLLACNSCAYELVLDEVARRVAVVESDYRPKPKAQAPKEYGDAPAQIVPFDGTVKDRQKMLGWEFDQVEEFNDVCSEYGKDPINTFLLGFEGSCVSYDQFIQYATTGKLPAESRSNGRVAAK
jgi:hypothetical protein